MAFPYVPLLSELNAAKFSSDRPVLILRVSITVRVMPWLSSREGVHHAV